MTNGDKLRSMNNEELAKFIYEIVENIEWDEDGSNNFFEDNFCEWLNEEVMINET